ncbi:hypothetical protein PV411_34090 [Streptomyces sp. NRRL_B-16638]|uniref:Secreted protein/lipoprotein n=2 Tax=Streptomyces coelicolor TaxID=1902 RepID=Q9ACY6_STRCO|nr:hypothetical protein [Streptomyces sp. NRRL_B-16638]AGO88627.1 secreted protein/lipoprotein [Streptomyces coelicolor]MDX2929536.1 hypothetical protein [Streptomyces sp. NRRL_B-16638]CAC36686.1 putative secreted protein/lipoprotein [Streptomyces coelicolor A3(2)]
MNRRAHKFAPSVVRFRNCAAVSLALSAAFLLTSCSSSDDTNEKPDTSPAAVSPTATASADPKETAKKEAIAAYEAYWKEMEKLYSDPAGKSAHLDRYAASAALENAEADAGRAYKGGNILIGDVTVADSTVTKADVTGKIPNVTLSNCLDISKWETVDAKTKKPADLPDNRLLKYLLVSTVEKYPEGWRVTRDEPQGKAC